MLRLEDAGLYECQANSEPKEQFSIELSVEDTIALISGNEIQWQVAAGCIKTVELRVKTINVNTTLLNLELRV